MSIHEANMVKFCTPVMWDSVKFAFIPVETLGLKPVMCIIIQ